MEMVQAQTDSTWGLVLTCARALPTNATSPQAPGSLDSITGYEGTKRWENTSG